MPGGFKNPGFSMSSDSLSARNSRNGRFVSTTVTVADGLFKRMKGLLGKDSFPKGESLWIKPCRGIHTVGMKFPIDVLFLDSENVIVDIVENIQPNRFSKIVFRARTVLELPAGTVGESGIEVGDRLVFAS